MFERQNDYQAIIFLKAARHCENAEKTLKYLVIFLSIVLCLCGIFNRYLPDVFRFFNLEPSWVSLTADEISKGITKADKVKTYTDSYLGLASGLLLLSQIFITRYTTKMRKEMNNLYERYDNYVYKLVPNKSILRPMNEIIIERYASKVWKKDSKFENFYFKTPEEASKDHAVFENIRKQFLSDYKILLSVKTFYKFIWYGFLAFIFVISLSFNKDFLSTLVTIIIPSLSIILMIFNSEHSYNEQMNYIQNNLNTMSSMRDENLDKRNTNPVNLNSQLTLRKLQDSLFSHRSNGFIIPNWLALIVSRLDARKKTSDYLYKNNIYHPIGEKEFHEEEEVYIEEVKVLPRDNQTPLLIEKQEKPRKRLKPKMVEVIEDKPNQEINEVEPVEVIEVEVVEKEAPKKTVRPRPVNSEVKVTKSRRN